MSDFIPRTSAQQDLFTQVEETSRSQSLMSTIDRINAKMGNESIKLASEGFTRPWAMKQRNKSPNYTTDWGDIVNVRGN